MANKGWQRAMQESEEIRRGANIINGHVTYQAVADAFGLEYTPVTDLFGVDYAPVAEFLS
jgi:alanine dehydrogenase